MHSTRQRSASEINKNDKILYVSFPVLLFEAFSHCTHIALDENLWCVKLLSTLWVNLILVNYENFSLCRFDGKLLSETFLWRQLIYCLVFNIGLSLIVIKRRFFYCRIKKICGVKNEMRKVFNLKEKFKSDLYD